MYTYPCAFQNLGNSNNIVNSDNDSKDKIEGSDIDVVLKSICAIIIVNGRLKNYM